MTFSPRLRALHTLVLLAFALALPLLELLERSAESLRARSFDGLDLALIAGAVVWAIPGALVVAKWGLERALPRPARGIHLSAVALLIAIIALQIIRDADAGETPGWVAVPGALAVGWIGVRVYARAQFVPLLLGLLSLALAILPLQFLLSAPVRRILAPPAATAYENPGTPAEVPVVFVVFDGLALTALVDEAGTIDAARFPHFAALAEDADFFDNATTVASDRAYALAALVTGRYPDWERPPTADEYPQNLFTLLGSHFAFNVVEPFTTLCPDALCGGIGISRSERLAWLAPILPGLALRVILPDDWADRIAAAAAAHRALNTNEEGAAPRWRQTQREHAYDANWLASSFLDRLVDRKGPALHFLHLALPDAPFHYLPSGLEYRPTPIHPDARMVPNARVDLEWAETQALQRQLLQMVYADTLLGRMRTQLEDEGLYDRALWIVTASRGSSLRPRTSRTELDDNLDNAHDLLWVPLWVKLPGQRRGHASSRNVESIDVLPTLLQVLDVRAPEPVDGTSLLSEPPAARSEKIVTLPARGDDPLQRARTSIPPRLPENPRTVGRISHLFGREGGVGALYTVGTYRALLGQDVSGARADHDSAYRVRLGDASAYQAVDRGTGFVPAHVTGAIEDHEALGPGPVDLAVAVNGSIRAVTRSFQDADGVTRFTAMVPEAAFDTGANRVEIFLILKRKTGVALVQTSLNP